MLQALFRPDAIAVIGASTDPEKLGHGIARNLVASGYAGEIYFVNPRGGELFGHRLYEDPLAIPEKFDLAVIATPAGAVPRVIEELGARAVSVAVVVSGGFAEVGEEGRELEADLIAAASEQKIRVLGPNCVGFLDTHLPLDITFLPPPLPQKGEIAFISHSGALCGALIDWARGMSFGFSRLINPGNTSDISEAELLAALGEDENTRVVAMYLEGLGDPSAFLEAAAELGRRKPLLAMKVGRSEAGAAAAQSHTGALAGEDAAYTAAFRKAGVLRPGTVEELFSWARALAWCPQVKGNRAAVMTNAGGPGVVAADAITHHDLRLAKLSAATILELSRQLPGPVSTGNPVDLLASAGPAQYEAGLRTLLSDPNVDAVLTIVVPPPMVDVGAVVEALIPVCRDAAKPVLLTVMGRERALEGVRRANAARVPAYAFPEQAASALKALVQRANHLDRAEADVLRPQRIAGSSRHSLQVEIGRWSGGDMPGSLAVKLLDAYCIPVLDHELVQSADQAVRSAGRLGYPVALKVSSPDILHKSDVGGVLLDLESAAAVEAGYSGLMRRVAQSAPDAVILGVLVEPMAPPGQDVILGMTRDPGFGPMLMFGSGGVEVEGLGDVSFALPPLSVAQAERMLDATWAGRRMRGYRNLSPGDRGACIDVLMRLQQIASDFPALLELEMNPLRVFPAGEGVVSLDVRACVAPRG